MATANSENKFVEKISPEVQEAFQLVRRVINQSGILERSKKLDGRRSKIYWALPDEMAARAFESYLKSKLEEKGIRNDYLVNYRTDESWQKAAEEGYKMDYTYPYPTAAEMEDIKMAYEYLFDSIRFKAHDKNYELYSASEGSIEEMLKESRLLFERELNQQQLAIQKMSEEVFDIEVKYFEGSAELHGRYDEDRDTMYVNSKAETSLEWTFWHEAFHIMKKYEPELYEDISNYIERHEVFSSQQIENYRQAIHQPEMNESTVKEEMLADAFADMKTGRRIVEKMAKEESSTAHKFIDFTKKLLDGVKKFFKAKEIKEKYPSVALTNKQFSDFVSRVEENICSVQIDKGKLAKESKGYKILTATNIPHSPYKYAPAKQRKFDVESAAELLKKYPSESVQQVIQDISPLGQKNKNYGKEILQEVN